MAHAGKPVSPSTPNSTWAPFTNATNVYMRLKAPVESTTALGGQCDFWDEAVAQLEASKSGASWNA